MPRRRVRDFIDRGSRVYLTPVKTLSEDECNAIIFYIYELAKQQPNYVVLDTGEIFSFIERLAKNTGNYSRLEKNLSDAIVFLEEKDLLHIHVPETNEESTERRRFMREENYKYEEDWKIARNYNFEETSETAKNYIRIMCTLEDETLSQIIYYTFFSKAKINLEESNLEVPARFKKLACDYSRVEFLRKETGLTEKEAGYILMRYRKASIERLDAVFDGLTKNSNELYTKLLGITKDEFLKIVRADSKIQQYGFINSDRELNQNLIDCIENQDFSLFFSDCIRPVSLDESYELESFTVPEENSRIYRQLLASKNSVSILLYGKPGSGKTEYAKSLIKKAGKKAMVFKNESEVSDRSKILLKLNCFLSLDRKDTVLIVDEAESVLETIKMTPFGPIQSSSIKGLVNKMMENSRNKVIWIVNHKSSMDRSTLRRFTASYRFESMPVEMLEAIAKKKLSTLGISEDTEAEILKMFSCYNITGSSVDNVVKTISSMKNRNEKILLKNVSIILKDNDILLNGNPKMREDVNPAYDLSVLNTSIPAEKIVRMLINAREYQKKNPGSGAVRMLFYGLSGTGKTEFARYISQCLGKKILLKRASDILDKYVGGTEENIADAFREAAVNDRVLLFDEADSFFSDRIKSERNFERTMVNEFLTQLEEFPGIVICTTNLRKIMDPALLRRFHISVDFKAMTEDGVKILLEKYFPAYRFTQSQIRDIASYNSVTPGDFGRLAGSIRFMDEDEISSEVIMEELCEIQKEKYKNDNSISRTIGFME